MKRNTTASYRGWSVGLDEEGACVGKPVMPGGEQVSLVAANKPRLYAMIDRVWFHRRHNRHYATKKVAA